MNNVTLISYPSHRDDSLLSLTDLRSRYMVPFAARFRVADFVMRNASAVDAKKTFIFSNTFDDLAHYVQSHPQYRNDETYKTKVVLETSHTLAHVAKLILEEPTQYYIIYNGDSPCIIDFEPVLMKFKAKKNGAVLYMLNFDGKPSMSRTALLCDRKTIAAVMKKALKDKVQSPNIFEMIINSMIIKGVKKETVEAYCRPFSDIPGYYNATYEAFRDKAIWEKVFGDPFMKSGIKVARYAVIGQSADIARSYISEGCEVHGTVHDSILFPGIFVGEKAVIRNSIVLPFCRIGAGVRIEKSLIDEFTDNRRQEYPLNIMPKSYIGTGEEGLKNADYPHALYESITLIGRNCALPEGVHIGAACYVSSGTADAAFEKTKNLNDGLSIISASDLFTATGHDIQE